MNRKLYNEITTTHLFEMEHKSLMNHARLFLTHYRDAESAAPGGGEDKDSYFLSSSSGFKEKVYIGHAGRIARYETLDESDVIINVIHLSGPMMRESLCCYGSIDLRRLIMEAADCKQCIGQIFVVDTPGGSSATKFDLQEAMDYAHSKGQLTAMYVDGMVCSAGMAWAAMCKKRYARHKHCQFGCMGTYAVFYTNKDKDVDAITQSMFHEVYASSSSLKNRSSRDSAVGDDTRMQKEVDKSNEQYLAIIRKGIPNATEEQLAGEIYDAGEVIGTLCDGVRTFDQVVEEMLHSAGFKMTRRPEGSKHSVAQSQQSFVEMAQSPDPIQAKGKGKSKDKEPDPEDLPDEPDPDEPGDPNDPVDPNAPDDPDDDTPDDDKPKKQSK